MRSEPGGTPTFKKEEPLLAEKPRSSRTESLRESLYSFDRLQQMLLRGQAIWGLSKDQQVWQHGGQCWRGNESFGGKTGIKVSQVWIRERENSRGRVEVVAINNDTFSWGLFLQSWMKKQGSREGFCFSHFTYANI